MGKAPCCDKEGMKKGPWTPEEDQKLVDYIQKHGPGRWRTLPKHAGLNRCGKSCRLRWTNYLRPDIKRGRFSFEEEETIIQLHATLGNKWSAIAARLPGRTDNEIKNYWNTHIKKRLLKMGIDPVTHAPRLDLLHLSSILNSSLYNSSQLNLTNLLGLRSLMDPNLLNLATAILSTQIKLQENQIENNPQILQTQFLGMDHQVNQTVSSTTSNITSCVPSLGVTLTQPMQQTLEQWIQEKSGFCTVPLSPNMWENNYEDIPQLACSPIPGSNSGSYSSDVTAMNNSLSENQAFPSINGEDDKTANLNFSSLLSTPLYSSSTTHLSGSTEDERDSFCSYLVMDDGNLDIGGIL